MAAGRSPRRILVSACVVTSLALGCAACGGSAPASVPAPTSTDPSPSSTTSPTSGPGDPTTSAPLTAPQASAAQDGQFFTEIAEADPALATYEQKQGNVALRALLTDGSAFCAFLQRGGGVDQALVSEAVGARGDESQTHLPLSITTFNTVEAVSLLALCPAEQSLLPAADSSRIRALGASLAGRSG